MKIKKIILLCAVILILSGCRKAPEDPSISKRETSAPPSTTVSETSETIDTVSSSATEVQTETEATTTTATAITSTLAITTVSDAPETFPSTEETIPPSVTDTTDSEKNSITDEIASVCEAYGLSVSYISGDGLHSYSYGGDKLYPSASTIKAMYCQYILESGASPDGEIVFESSPNRTSSSGFLTEDKRGTVFTVGELIDYTIRYSDNMAYRLLFDTYGITGYNAWVDGLGIQGLSFSRNYEFIDVSAIDLSRGMLEILRLSEKDSTLIDLLKSSNYKKQIASGTSFEVGSKYGYQGGTKGYHDTAIVYAPRPYVLTVMSNIPADTAGSIDPFIKVTKLTDRLNALLYQY